MNSILNEYLSRIELREPQQFKNIVILPVFAGTEQRQDYLTLTEALQQQLATITEVSGAGQVPNVKVTNGSELFLLLIDGEELVGARQNRTLNTSILLGAKSETVVPVSCTEAGRWSYESAAFADAGYVSPHKLRKIKSSSVAAALRRKLGYKSNQKAIWDSVHLYCLDSHAHSPTSAMHDAVVAKAKDLDECLDSLKPLPDQKGVVVLVNGEVAGADILSSARAYQAMHPKFIRSYAMEALLDNKTNAAERPQEKVAAFFESFKGTTEQAHQGVGCGQDHRFEGNGVSGAALVAENQIVHLNLYRN